MSDRNTPWRNGELVAASVAAATMIYGGHMVGLNASGLAVPASASTTLTIFGVSDEYADNTAGAAGATSVMVRRGKAWKLANLSGDAVTQADVGKSCYVADSITVAKTSNTDARPVAGTVIAVESDGVWVEI
ncbi:TPA: hypothetical protein ACYFH0_001907 [Klebsiella pneumoniae]|uniref:Uncharacterized protein n=1 Tax=Raoultella ornithinolytica TaxID=54291 RepID=A0A855EWJ0_RAOOR|nr:MULTISPECIES: hypothetical protein [Klebsiella/Raoultella group]HCB0898994.1 hypothetical protein [Klebsiella variicola subsp. variicola]EKW5829999.1 hypothetical protein [Klebsiella pneumoniae]ELA2703101.1 hypothetical protein [Klebsiella pneumoniae]ELI8805874.1 hypothetical protein [Klebsiella michiganensis]ELS4495512.1 hypothetical protein [Klebsiella michiganensis]